MSKKKNMSEVPGDSKNSYRSVLDAPIELRAFIATCFVLFLMFLTGISGYAWGHTQALEAQALENLSASPAEKTLFHKDTDTLPLYERAGVVLGVNKDFFIIRFLDADKEVMVYPSPKTGYFMYPGATGPETFDESEAQKIGSDQILSGTHVQVYSDVDMRSADSFFATKIVKLP